MFLANQRKRGGGEQPMRIARPGERPPSRRAEGEPDTLIDRFDAYVQGLRR